MKTMIAVSLDVEDAVAFSTKCEKDKVGKSKKISEWIKKYVKGELK